MKIGKKLVALCLGATLALGSVFGLAACTGNNDDTGSAGDPNIRLVYNMYVENCAETGEEALTYEEWLASIKGAKGDKGDKGAPGEDGLTPHIDAETGYWFIGDKNTGIKAAGSNGTNGVTPHIGENGNWFIGDEDSHVPATGAKGDPGDDGTNGTSFLHGKGKPDAALGSEGDLYLDLETYDLYEKTAEGWSTDPVGNIKGAKGDKGDSATGGETEPAETVIKEYKGVTINASGTYQLDLTAIDNGYYWLVADTQTTAAAGVLTVSSVVSYLSGSSTATSIASYDLYSSKNRVFKGIVSVDSDTSKRNVTINNKSTDNITADLKLVKYTPVTITLGEEVEIPCLSSVALNGADGRAPVLFDTTSMGGKQLKITVSYLSSSISKPLLRYNATAGENPKNVDTGNSWDATDKQDNGIWIHTFTMPSDAVELFFLTGDRGGSGCNAVVKIELAS